MSKYAFVNLIDKIFITFSIFLFVFAWINFYLRDIILSFVLSIVFSFALTFVLFYILNKKNIQKKLTKTRKNNIELSFLSFKLLDKTNKLKILTAALKNYHPKIENDNITYNKDGKQHIVILATHLNNLDYNMITNLIDEKLVIPVDEIDIICSSSSVKNYNLLKNVKVNIIDKVSLYTDWFEQNNITIDSSNIAVESKVKFKELLRSIFAPQKAKSYFCCGLILIFSSIIIPFSAYYVVMGSMLIMFAIICKLLPKFSS